LIALGFVALGLAGCQGPQKQESQLQIGEHLTRIEDLAARLGLRIEEREETFVVLKNSVNTVLIFTHPDGRFFVNGKPIGTVGEVTRSGGMLYVPDLLVSQIRPHLRSTLPALPPPTPPKPRGLIVVDAGHGGRDPGAIGSGGIYEKTINLQVAQRVAGLLAQRGVSVIMTRRDDRFIELEDRADLANQRNADLFVSIHSDSAPNRQVQGFTLYVAGAASASARRAAGCLNRTLAATGSEGHGIREADYKVLVQTNCPAILIELGYLSNPQDTLRLKDPTHQNRLAQAIADGILTYLQ